MNISILGCGRWGAFHAWYAPQLGHQTTIWGRKTSRRRATLAETRRNQYLQLPDDVVVSDDLDRTLASADTVVVAVGAQDLRDLCRQVAQRPVAGKTFILCIKGLEAVTGLRLSQVFRQEVTQPTDLAVWLGPGHVQEFVRGVPNCMTIDSEDVDVTKRIVAQFGSKLIRFYYGQDLIGNEVGAASKNVMGIAAGMLDGLDLSSLKGALMARGAREVSRLVRAMGGSELTIYGLCHLGDYEATLFSPHSHNRRFGEAFVRREPFEELAEGVATVEAMRKLSQRHGVELPICDAVYSIIVEGQDLREVFENLFLRPTKFEF